MFLVQKQSVMTFAEEVPIGRYYIQISLVMTMAGCNQNFRKKLCLDSHPYTHPLPSLINNKIELSRMSSVYGCRLVSQI